MKSISLMVAIAVLLVGGGATLANIDFTTKRVARNNVAIDTVQEGTMEIKVSATGLLLSKNIEEISALVPSRVEKKLVKPGDVVKVGQLLVELINPQLLATADEAYSAWQGAVADEKSSEAELQSRVLDQEAAVTQAQFNLERMQLQLVAETRLIGEHIIPEIDFKRTTLTVDQLKQTLALGRDRLVKSRDYLKAQTAVKQSRVMELARALDRAKNDANNLRVLAGLGGIVQEISVEVGQQLQPGNIIGRIAQQGGLYAELKVPAREATDVQVGESVMLDTRGGTVNGVVSRVDPGVTDGTVVVDVDLPDILPAGARPQLQVEGVIYLSKLADTLFVGKPAYVKTNSAISVYKIDSTGRYANRVTVNAGKLSLNYLQILGGLRAGDRIITSDIGEWRDKDRILIN